ncbi:hypothetical protein F511_30234 [Dorcoceras hygrometricum]|uniref:Uncharacterized protein n=1 Tax=Dorcoceras hygrometricum TaxID=472368 RepID=A0A2Z7A0K7_9LAMI|nr:hypothetical protein F511_30234 [Dorcoceras hygrometricum]
MERTDWENPDDWELINDDAFVYKRKKRQLQDSLATSSDANQPPNPEDSRRNLRERKRKVLLKLREKYLNEIRQWERLSNILKEMEANPQTQFQEREEICCTVSLIEPSRSEERSLPDYTHRRLVDDLLSQVEAQEAIIRGVSHLCDVADSLCTAQEERLKQQFIELPIWESSPCDLIVGLTDQ